MAREPRLPLEKARFDVLPLNTARRTLDTWWNLRYVEYAKASSLFYASPGARFTPLSMSVPCLYLARTQETAFKELYGDRLYLARLAKTLLIIDEDELDRRVFVSITTKELRVLDLIDGRAGESIHFDAGTIWADDITFPQSYAGRIHAHPAAVDGIRYRSRHTNEECIALWPVRPGLASLRRAKPHPLRATSSVAGIGSLNLFGEEILLAGVAP